MKKTVCLFVTFYLPIIYLAGVYPFKVGADILEQLEYGIRFQKLPFSDELSGAPFKDTAEDHMGFIWIASEDGLYRFDGYTSINYRPIKNQANSLSHSNITSLLVDQSGILWVGTRKGLNRYNADSNTFTHVGVSVFGQQSLSGSNILRIFQDSNLRIWVVTEDGGVNLLTHDGESIEPIPFDKSIATDGWIYSYDVIETMDNRILVGSSMGVFQFNDKLKRLERFVGLSETKKIFDKKSLKLLNIDNDQLLIGTANGLYALNLQTSDYFSVLPATFESKRISTLSRFSPQKLLIGTKRSGLFLVDLSLQSYKHFESSPDKYSLLDNRILSVRKSQNNLIWISTHRGVNLIDPGQQAFGHIKSNKNYPDCLSGNEIYHILQDSHNRVWIAAYRQGLNLVDLNTNQCKRFQIVGTSENEKSLKFVTSLFEDQVGNIWIGTSNNGIVRYLSEQQKFQVFNVKTSLGSGVSEAYISAGSADNSDRVWIATRNDGVFEFNIKTQKLSHHDLRLRNKPDIKVQRLLDIELDSAGRVWLATASHGLWVLEQTAKYFTQVEQNNYDNRQIPLELVSLDRDRQDDLWIGSQFEGAFRYSPKTGEVANYSTKNGLLNNGVMHIQQDGNNHMWLMTEKGLSRLSLRDETIKTFLEQDGLQGDDFTPTGFFDPVKNLLWTGGINGFNRFNPDQIEINGENVNQKTVITDFQLFHKSVKPNHLSPGSPLGKDISQTKSLRLSHEQNVFAFTFSGLEFIAPESIRYRYQLEGYDTSWNNVPTGQRYANYTNIDPGRYVFKVQSTNKYGVWSNFESKIQMDIAFPWWQTNLAYTSYLVAFIFCIYLLVKIRTRSLVEHSKELEQSVFARTEELALEKQKLSIEKKKVEQLLLRRNEEFANVSHEFRTPLTLILGPIAKLLKDSKKPEEIKRLNIVQRNGYRLLRMVDQLLNMETFRNKSITRKIPQATGKIIRLIIETFTDLSNEKNIQLTLGRIADINFEFTQDALEKIVLNLLSNAIKYTKPGGTIFIETVRTEDNHLKIQVKDTGIGIPKNQLNSVFERFNRVLDDNSEQVTGAGIGLALVKDLVEAHQGRIELESKIGKGTTINVYIPIVGEVDDVNINLHLDEEMMAMEVMGLTNQSALSDSNEIISKNQQPLESDFPRVLLIEDNKDMRDYIVDSMQSDYQMLTAQDGKEGLKVAISEIPDLIISDVMMPKMDGYETTHQLRENQLTNHIPIILLTARGDKDSRLKGWHEKADEYLTKPFDIEELKIRSKTLLEIRNIIKRRYSEIAFQSKDQSSQWSAQQTPDIEISVNKKQAIFVTKLNKMLEEIYDDPTITVDDIANKLFVSKRQLSRKLKSILDMSPFEYLRRFRLEKARRLLVEEESVGVAAFKVGFATQGTFTKCFKAQFGVLPSDYKNSMLVQYE